MKKTNALSLSGNFTFPAGNILSSSTITNTFRSNCFIKECYLGIFESYSATSTASNEVSSAIFQFRKNGQNISTSIPNINLGSNLQAFFYYYKNGYNKLPIYQTFQAGDTLLINIIAYSLAAVTANISVVFVIYFTFDLE